VSDEYRHRTRVEVRFRDVDAFGHVNNAVIATYVEQARVTYLHDVAGIQATGPDGMPLILAHLAIDYEAPVYYGDQLAVESRVDWIGRTSLGMSHRVEHEADGRALAVASTVLVAFDYAADRPMPVPDAWRVAMAAHEGRSLERVAVAR